MTRLPVFVPAQVHIEFTEGQDKITVEGAPEEVQEAKRALEETIADLMARMDFAEIEIDQKFHKHIIGKNGVNSELSRGACMNSASISGELVLVRVFPS